MSGRRALRIYPACKVAGEFVAALLLLVVTSPLLLLAAILVKMTSRGPIIYSQVRLGRHGRPFSIHKVRTMEHDCESKSGPQWSQPGDARVTWVGRFLRASHIDELPQLWNVLKGEMSLVGPRPERPEFVPQLEQAIPLYRARLLVRPGITGLAQLQLAPDTDLHSVRRKLAHDIHYVRHLSFWLDFRIMLSTGLSFLGVPYRWHKRVLRIPAATAVEQAYERITEVSSAPELQPVCP